MRFITLVLSFATASLAQAYTSNYAQSSQNTISRRACYRDEHDNEQCITPQSNVGSLFSRSLNRRACFIDKDGKQHCVNPKPVAAYKKPTAIACKTGGCFIDRQGVQHCDNIQLCETIEQ